MLGMKSLMAILIWQGCSNWGRKATSRDFDRPRKSIDKAEHLCKEGKETDKIYQNFDLHVQLAQITRNTILVDTLCAITELLTHMMVKIRIVFLVICAS